MRRLHTDRLVFDLAEGWHSTLNSLGKLRQTMKRLNWQNLKKNNVREKKTCIIHTWWWRCKKRSVPANHWRCTDTKATLKSKGRPNLLPSSDVVEENMW